jgi:hypothetical protein
MLATPACQVVRTIIPRLNEFAEGAIFIGVLLALFRKSLMESGAGEGNRTLVFIHKALQIRAIKHFMKVAFSVFDDEWCSCVKNGEGWYKVSTPSDFHQSRAV